MAGNVAIIGLGLIGASLGLALKGARSGGVHIVGYDKEPLHAREAQRRGAVDAAEWTVPNTVQEADLIIIATPVNAIRETLEAIAKSVPPGATVTDTGSTKRDVIKWADELLPKHVSFVGGHPMAGKETSGPGAADPALFQGATYCILPSRSARPESVEAVVAIVQLVGAKPFFVDPAEHDTFVAAVSHLPLVLSSTLVASTAKSPSWGEMSRLAASGYRDVSRLASGDPEMNRDICLTNGPEIALWIDRLIAELQLVKKYLNDVDADALSRYFVYVAEERRKWTSGNAGKKTGPTVDVPGAGEQLQSMLLGQMLARRSRDLLRQQDKDGAGSNR